MSQAVDSTWTEYPLRPNAVGNIVEDLNLIVSLLGSPLYEWGNADGVIYIRRIDD